MRNEPYIAQTSLVGSDKSKKLTCRALLSLLQSLDIALIQQLATSFSAVEADWSLLLRLVK